jgi:hypothetical protein
VSVLRAYVAGIAVGIVNRRMPVDVEAATPRFVVPASFERVRAYAVLARKPDPSKRTSVPLCNVNETFEGRKLVRLNLAIEPDHAAWRV